MPAPLRYKITGVTDTAGTPNSMTDQTTFTEVTAIKAETPVTNIGIQTASDSGADDNITNDTTAPVIEFTQTSGATVTAKYRKTGAAQWTTIPSNKISATGTAGTITLPNLTAGDGDYEMEITQQATGKQARTAHYSFTLDTTAPSVFTDYAPFYPRQTPFKISDGGGDIDISLSEGDQFGGATALSGDGTTLVISAPQSDSSKGSVYLFEKSNNTWTQSLKISDNDGGTGELDVPMSGTSYFGAGVSLSADGTLLAVGAYGQDSFKGAVYLFKKTNGTWAQSLKISDNDGGAGELDISLTAGHALGTSVALSQDGTLLAIGSRDASHKGAVYLFEKSGSTYVQKLKISDNESGTGELDVQLGVFSYFGSSIDFSADTTLMAVGADSVNGRGAVYLFEKRDGAWTQTLKIYDISGDADEGELDIELSSSDGFGIDVSLSDDGTLLVVGAYGTDKGETPDEVGAVYLFEKSGGTWSQSLEMSDNNGGTGKFDISLSDNDFFGTAVTISDNRDLLVIGAGGDSSYKGAVYIFEDVGVARSVFVTATDNEQNGSSWEYVTTTGSTCGAAQFATTQTAYTEGSRIAFTAESDAGKRVCFKTTDTAGNAAVYTLSEPVKTIDRTAPTLSVIRSGAGATANYRVNATDTGNTDNRQDERQCRRGFVCGGYRHKRHRLDGLHTGRTHRNRTRHQRQVCHHH